MPKVSVIMAAYNGSKTISQSIASILGQTFTDLELIVVDDGSTDDTRDMIEDVKDERIVLLKQKNSGAPAAPRNAGIEKASGEFIAFCDQDDIWYPEKLEKQLEAFDSSEQQVEIGIIFSGADLIDENDKKVNTNIPNFEGFLPAEAAHTRMLAGDFIIACSAVLPQKVLSEVGLLDEALVGVDDYDLWLRITEKYGVLAVPEKLCAWRQTHDSLSANKTKQYLENEKIFKDMGDKTPAEKTGHGKNMLRIIMASLLVHDFVTARAYLDKITNYPMSTKAKAIVNVSKLSPSLGRLLVVVLQSIGKVAL